MAPPADADSTNLTLTRPRLFRSTDIVEQHRPQSQKCSDFRWVLLADSPPGTLTMLREASTKNSLPSRKERKGAPHSGLAHNATIPISCLANAKAEGHVESAKRQSCGF